MNKYTLKAQLPQIRQGTGVWCIPACIEIALKYLKPNFSVSQRELWDILDNSQPSFGIYKKLLSQIPKFSPFKFEHWGPGKIADLQKKIKEAIKKDCPVLLSTPAAYPARGWHIRVCHTITEKDVTMYNPGDGENDTEEFNDIVAKIKNRNGGDILIIGLKRR